MKRQDFLSMIRDIITAEIERRGRPCTMGELRKALKVEGHDICIDSVRRRCRGYGANGGLEFHPGDPYTMPLCGLPGMSIEGLDRRQGREATG